ncbi:hypothetical protein H1W37_13160 [Stappia taiwanensis]|uniref:Uncharacterized protein n=1 Tax=Stappia taiwanensis TaxID=992267 RepID=A0A838XMV7_9HYPH|nr:hypothetical protein [Stappia taiwanensis]MBA4612609.1 hypothetical protein [Stappia taiwanensis]GGE89107.1 hypothetical protein GCM10007285_15730 [Stappia taiwanensis]
MSGLSCFWEWLNESAAGISAFASLFAAFAVWCVAFIQNRSNERARIDSLKVAKIERISRDVGDALKIARSWEMNISAEHSPFELDIQTYSAIERLVATLNRSDKNQKELIDKLDSFRKSRGKENVCIASEEVRLKCQDLIADIRSAKSVSDLL